MPEGDLAKIKQLLREPQAPDPLARPGLQKTTPAVPQVVALRPCEFTPLQLASRYGHLEVKHNSVFQGCHVKGSVCGYRSCGSRWFEHFWLRAPTKIDKESPEALSSKLGNRQSCLCCYCWQIMHSKYGSQLKGCVSASLCLPGLAESTPLLEAVDHQHLHVAGLMLRTPCHKGLS